MSNKQLLKRFDELVSQAEKNGVDQQFKKLIQKIKADLENTDPNTSVLETRLKALEKNINQEIDPIFVLQRLRKHLEDRVHEITHHYLLQFDSSRALHFHPFDLLQHDNINQKISEYLENLKKLLITYQSLIKKLPTQVDQIEKLSEFLAEKELLEKKYQEIKRTKPQVSKIKDKTTLKRILAQHPDKIEIRGYCGQTPFIAYAIRGNQKLMSVLLENGANINAQTDLNSEDQGNTALIWLIANANVEEALWLISIGNQHKINWDLFGHGNTALHLAIAKGPEHVDDGGKKVPGGFRKIINNLIDLGANVNLKDKRNGFSPLHFAVLHRDLETIQKLIDAGADINSVDNENRKPLDMLNISPKDTKKILADQCAVFTLNEENWKIRGNEVKKLLQVDLSSSTEPIEVDESESSLSEKPSIENFPTELVSKLSKHAKDIKADNPKTLRQRDGNIKSEKIDDLVKSLIEANNLKECQKLVNDALKSEYKKGRQQNPLLVNRGPFHAYWIHSIFSNKRNIESHRLSRSATEDLLIDLKKAIDEAVLKEAKSSISHN